MTPIFHRVINGEKSVERRNLIHREFKKINLEPCFLKAIMGKDLSLQERDKLVSPSTPITEGEIGCALSHLACYKELITSNANSMLIFEDDIEFTNMVDMPLLLNFQQFIDQLKEPSILMLKPPDVKLKYMSKVNDIKIYTTNYIWCSHAYFINKTAAKHILDIQSPVHFPADTWSYFTLLKPIILYAIDTTIIHAGAQPSIIDQNSTKKRLGTMELCKGEFYKIIRENPKLYNEKNIKKILFKRKLQRVLSNLSRIPKRTKEKLKL